ncbi:Uncharacterised protein [Blautia hydrogenotrophica]|nr:Uncharacterised protein [Blautia hydrogenotrophica]SCH76659.1 Uncharacterised protein [uncultured Blautia sp.]
MKMLLMQPAAGGESCGAGFFFMLSFLKNGKKFTLAVGK